MAESKTKTVEVDGFKLTVDMDLFDDVEFFQLADEIDTKQSNIAKILKLVARDDYDALVAYFKNKDGRFKMSVASQFIDKLLALDPKE